MPGIFRQVGVHRCGADDGQDQPCRGAARRAEGAEQGARYRRLAKKRALLFTLFALGNLFLVRKSLMA